MRGKRFIYFVLSFVFVLHVGPVKLNAGVSEYSFRIKGMGSGILDFTHDTYSDVFYNPAYIANVEGLHIYTNLSNLGRPFGASLLENEVSFLQNNIYPSNLIGAMGRWRFLSGGVFYVSEGMNLQTDVTTDNESFFDPPEGQGPTRRDVYNSESTAEFNMGGRQLIGVGTLNLFGLKLGVMGKLRRLSLSQSYNSEYTSKDYQDGGLIESVEWASSAEFSSSYTALGFTGGTVIGGETTELSISGGLEPGGFSLNSDFMWNWIEKPYYYAYYDSLSTDPDENFRVDTDKSTNSFSLIGSELFGKVRLMQKLGERTRTSLFGRISTGLFPISVTDEQSNMVERDHPNEYDSGGQVTNYGFYRLETNKETQNGSGNFRFVQFGAGLGVEHTFENNSLLILGVKGKYLHSSGKIETNPRKRTTVYRELTDDPDGDDYGYIETINYKNSSVMDGSVNVIWIEIPSALEFNIRERLQFRVGANQYIPVYAKGSYTTSLSDEPNETTIKYTDGPNAGDETTQINEYDDENDEKTEFNVSSSNLNLARYYTGLGYQVNENIDLDILHYTNVTRLNTWYLSFTIHL